jgi:hypothetical protein
MKKTLIALSSYLLFAYTGLSQLISPQDKLALQIPEQQTYTTTGISSYVKSNFTSDSDRVRAIFVWVANNINYDVEKVRLKKIQERTTIEDVLRSRKAVCQGYSELFVALNKECNINSTLISGYTKMPDGSISELSHAWVAAEINNKWYLFDPTWAAGMVKDFQFTRMFSNRFYKKLPEEMIKDHMPFDPMYQFLNHTVSFDEFNKGNTAINTSKPYFSYTDTIKAYNKLDTLSKFVSVARRINKNGERNQLVYDFVKLLNKNQDIGQSKMGFEGAVASFKKSTDLFNSYIDHKNKRFSAVSNKEIQEMIDGILEHFNAAKEMIQPVNAVNDEQKRTLKSFNDNLYSFYRRVDEEKIFLKTFLKTDRSTVR